MSLSLIDQLDANDPLKSLRKEFLLPDGVLYFDGNSLGPLPIRAKALVDEVVSAHWGQDLISSWNKNEWIDWPKQIGDSIAPIIGAKKGQVICCDSISVNLFKLLASALSLSPNRSVVLSEQGNFPTDLYMVQGLNTLMNDASCELKTVPCDAIFDALDETVAVLMLTHVNFRNGRMHDMQAITNYAHDRGVLVLWDLAHSAGAVPVALDACEVDFAVGCGYKYLNGGPGAPAFVYVADRHINNIRQPLSGWMGHAEPFAFSDTYQPANGIEKFLSGTPNILSMAALKGALQIFDNLDITLLRRKSQSLMNLFTSLVTEAEALQEFNLITPLDPKLRGSQLAYTHQYAYAISQALIDHKIIVDFRSPNIVRFGFTPLYLSHADVAKAVKIFEKIFVEGIYRADKYSLRSRVT